MTKKKLLPLLLILILILSLVFIFGCTENKSPVENISVTTLPQLQYYRGDKLNLENAEITVYYENGNIELVPLTIEMLSDFNSDTIGEQLLTIAYDGATSVLKVEVSEAPIYSISVNSTSHKTKYVSGQSFSAEDLTLEVVYINGFEKTVDVSDDMVSGFDTDSIGEQQLLITYGGKTTTFAIDVERRQIANVEIIWPKKLSYAVGQTLDLTDGYFEIAYTDNTSIKLDIAKLYKDNNPSFSIEVEGEEGLIFTKAARTLPVYVSYEGQSKQFYVTVSDIKVVSAEIITKPSDLVVDGTIDFGPGALKVIYNNETEETLLLNSEKIQNNASEVVDIETTGQYTVRFTIGEINVDCVVNVVNAFEKDLEIILPENIKFYQDTGTIDYSQWKFKIKLSNGSYKKLNVKGDIEANISKEPTGLVVLYDPENKADFTTNQSGGRSYTFIYKNAAGSGNLKKTVFINIIHKEIVGISDFKAPDIKTYLQGEPLNLSGGLVQFKYNNNAVSELISLTKDMFSEEVWDNATSIIGENLEVEFIYTDSVFETSYAHSFKINVIEKIESVTVSAQSNHALTGIQGYSFNSDGLVLEVCYLDGSKKLITAFDANKWTFLNTDYDNVGKNTVKIVYGDINDTANRNFVNIEINVTNNITAVAFDTEDGAMSFGTIIEGQEISLSGCYLRVTYQNNSCVNDSMIKVAIVKNMLPNPIDYNRSPGFKQISVSYGGKTLTATVIVNNKELTEVVIAEAPDKLKYVNGDTINLDGLLLRLNFNNSTTKYLTIDYNSDLVIDDANNKLILTENGIVYEIFYSYDDNLKDEYTEKEIVLTVRITLPLGTPTVSEAKASYMSYWFEILPEKIELLVKNGSEYTTLPVINAKEGVENFDFPENTVLRVTYNSDKGLYDYYDISELLGEYTLSGFNYKKSSTQTITLEYVTYKCSFTVYVREKILSYIMSDYQEIDIIEGSLLSGEFLSFKAHYVDADGNEFGIGSPYSQIGLELNQLSSDYNPNEAINFGNNQTVDKIITFGFGGKNCTVKFIISQKSLVSISWAQYPQRVYIEGYNGDIDFTGGKILVAYNNGSTDTLDLNSDLLIKNTAAFDTDIELYDNSETVQEIFVEYVYNGIQKSTSYLITVKDRKYLNVLYKNIDNIYDGIFEFVYGVTKEARPEFDIMDGSSVFINNANIDAVIAQGIGFDVVYENTLGVRNSEWVKDVGIYTIVISYGGDEDYNAFIDTSMRIKINKRKINVVADTVEGVVYGDDGIDFLGHFESAEQDGQIYGFVTDQNKILDIGYRIYRGENLQHYDSGVVLLDVTDEIFNYTIRPYVNSELASYDNYEIKEFVSSELKIHKKEIAIVAESATDKTTKMYGENDPVLEYYVYDNADYESMPDDAQIIGRKYYDNLNKTVIAYIILNGAEISISDYSLLRDYNSDDVNNVGTHEISQGKAENLKNFKIVNFKGAQFTITKRPITIYADRVTKKFGQVNPHFKYKAANESDFVYNDDLTTVFGLQINPDTYNIKFYKDADCSMLVSENGDLPLSTGVGKYYAMLQIDGDFETSVKNYDVTVMTAEIEIIKNNAAVILNKLTKKYGDNDPIAVFNIDYTYEFEDTYMLENNDEFLKISLIREIGEDIGSYLYSLSSNSNDNNVNFNITLEGERCLNIFPRELEYTVSGDMSANYDRILLSEMQVNFKSNDDNYVLNESDREAIANSITYYWEGRNEAVQGTGFAVVDIYDVTVACDYSILKNFVFTNWMSNMTSSAIAEMQEDINSYITEGIEFSRQYLLKYGFIYEITPKDIIMTFDNLDEYNYTGDDIPLEISEYTVCQGDSLDIAISLEAIYEQMSERVSVYDSILTNAGKYFASFIDIGNSNYALSNSDYVKEIIVKPIVIKVEIKDAQVLTGENDEYLYSYHTSVYTGLRIRNIYDDGWSKNTDASTIEENGYYYNLNFKIVSEGLTKAPNEIIIRPNYTNNGIDDLPKDVGVYDFKYFINNNYKNYEVQFVRNSGGKYVDADFKYVITKRIVTIENLAKFVSKEYDGTMPAIGKDAQLIIQVKDCTTTEDITIDDIKFTFERNMDKVPDSLKGVVGANDFISAGYFNISAECVTSNNFICQLIDANEYVIKRINVPIQLNSSVALLQKQYDMTAPSGTADMLSFVGGTASYYKINTDDVHFDLDTIAYWENNAWTTALPEKYDIGYYGYVMKPKFLNETGNYSYFIDGGNEYKDEITGQRLLDWNHTFSVIAPSSGILNSYDGISELYGSGEVRADGIYLINKRNITLQIDGGIEEIRDYGGSTDQTVYVYYYVYNKSAVSKTMALAIMNNYTAYDETGNNVAVNFDFTKINMTCDDEITQIVNTGERFVFNINAIILNNNNYNITIQNIIFEVGKLPVKLKAIFTYDNSGDSTMIYGSDMNKVNYALEFADKEQFIDDMALGITADELLISDYLGGYDNEHFNVSGIAYILKKADGTIAYNSLDAAHSKLVVDTYISDVLYMANNSKNFVFEFIATDFTVEPKEIVINKLKRTYFNNDITFNYTLSTPITASDEVAVVNSLFNDMLKVFVDGTEIDDGIFVPEGHEIYYAMCSKTAINDVLNNQKYRNYYVNLTKNECSDDISNASSNNYYLPLTINKRKLSVYVVDNNGEPIHLEYGKKLNINNGDFTIFINGFAVLNTNATEQTHNYDYITEQGKQSAVNNEIMNKILDLTALTDEIKIQNYNNGRIDTLDIINYYNTEIEGHPIDLNTYFDNYSIDLQTAKFIIEKININVKLVNNNGIKYDSDGSFTVLFDEINKMKFSEEAVNPTRLNYDIEISNKNSIVGYNSGESYTLLQLLQLMNINNGDNFKIETIEQLSEAIKYKIYKQGFANVSAGICRMELTADWYKSVNYNLVCQYTSIVVYPKVSAVGNDGVNGYYMPNTAAAMIGEEGDIETFKNNLSMFVKLNYLGMPNYDSEWVDIRITTLTDSSLYKEYKRQWQIIVKDEDSQDFDYTQFAVGKEIELCLKYTETFYQNSISPVVNTITTKYFKVRLYGKEDVSLIKGDSYFISGDEVYNYGDIISDSGTYTLGAYKKDNNGNYLTKEWNGKNYFSLIEDENRYKREFTPDTNGMYIKEELSFYYQISDVANRTRYSKDGEQYIENLSGKYVKIDINGVDVYVDILTSKYRYGYCKDENGEYVLVNYPQGNRYIKITSEMRMDIQVQENSEGSYVAMDTNNGYQYYQQIIDARRYTDSLGQEQNNNGNYLKINKFNGSVVFVDLSLVKRYKIISIIKTDGDTISDVNEDGSVYFAPINEDNRYKMDYYTDSLGNYYKVNYEDYFYNNPILRQNIIYTATASGNYILIETIGDVDYYTEIRGSYRYSYDTPSKEYYQNDNGEYLKVEHNDGSEEYMLLSGRLKYKKEIADAIDGKYLNIKLIVDASDIINMLVLIEDNHKYIEFVRDNNGDYLKMDIYGNTYYELISDDKLYTTSTFADNFDMLDTRFYFEPVSEEDFYADMLLYEDGSRTLKLRMEKSGFKLLVNDVEALQSDESLGNIENIDLFDGYSHSMKIYIDKLGSNPEMTEGKNSYFYVLIVIDDCYTLKFLFTHQNSKGEIEFEFDGGVSNVRMELNKIKATITKYDVLSMGVEVFTNNNYLADILLLPNAEFEADYDNYSYQITIPTENENGKVSIDLSQLFVVDTVNSSAGYSPDNYYFEYFVDGNRVFTDNPNNISGSSIVDFDAGIFEVVIKMYLRYTGAISYTYLEKLTKTVKFSISRDYNIVPLKAYDGTYQKPSVSTPIMYDIGSGTYFAAYSENIYGIKYNKTVFDFMPNGSTYIMQTLLKIKSTDEDFLYGKDMEFYGIMVENSSGHTYIHIRYSGQLLTLDLGELKRNGQDAWIGNHNVLEAFYVANNAYVLIRLSRGSDIIFEKKIYQQVEESLLSKKDIQDSLVNTGSSYTGLYLNNVNVTVYKYEVGNKMLGAVDFIDSESKEFISGISKLNRNTKVLVSNADGTAYVSSGKNFQISFKASALDYYNNIPNEELVRFVVINNTSRLMPMDEFNVDTFTGDRGIYFSIINISSTQRQLRMYLYKYNEIYKEQIIETYTIGAENDLLNGNEHTLKIEFTTIKQTYTAGGEQIDCYRVKIFVDNLSGAFYQALYPIDNNLFSWQVDGETGHDTEASYNARDTYFVSEINYSGIITKNATIEVTDLAVS